MALPRHVGGRETRATAAHAVPLAVADGIAIGPPGEFASRAVKTSNPVFVTSKVCSMLSALVKRGETDLPTYQTVLPTYR